MGFNPFVTPKISFKSQALSFSDRHLTDRPTGLTEHLTDRPTDWSDYIEPLQINQGPKYKHYI